MGSKSLRELAETVLFGQRLEDKLTPLTAYDDEVRGAAITPPRYPGRPDGLAFGSKGARAPFPKRHELERDSTRGIVLHFFANHELLALELMALALLRFPDAPAAFRHGIARTMAEEQRHLGLYIARMQELGVQFGELGVSEYFWNALGGMKTPFDYVTGMSLTFEQANLDYSLYYRDVFRELGDEATAAIMDVVYREEIGHVKHGVVWFDRWRDPEQSQWQAYQAALELPLSPSRAKGLAFAAEGRRAAGLDDDYVAELKIFSGSKGRPPRVHWYNVDCELEIAHGGPGYCPSKTVATLIADLAALPLYLAKAGDLVMTPRRPGREFLDQLAAAGFALPEWVTYGTQAGPEPEILGGRKIEGFEPWGVSPRACRLAKAWRPLMTEKSGREWPPAEFSEALSEVFAKTSLVELRAMWRSRHPELWRHQGPELVEGQLAHSVTDVLTYAERLHAEQGLAAVIKARFGAAGQGMIRLFGGAKPTATERAWLDNQLASFGAVLVEPWLERVYDFSVQLDVGAEDPVLGITRFWTDRRGQYGGHRLEDLFGAMPSADRIELARFDEQGRSLVGCLHAAGRTAATWLVSKGFRGPAGLDVFFYRSRLPGYEDRLLVKAIGEVNPRRTMGQIALALEKRLSGGVSGGLWTLGSRELKAFGHSDFVQFAQWLVNTYAPELEPSSGHLREGAVVLTDPASAERVMAIMAAGQAATSIHRTLGTGSAVE